MQAILHVVPITILRGSVSLNRLVLGFFFLSHSIRKTPPAVWEEGLDMNIFFSFNNPSSFSARKLVVLPFVFTHCGRRDKLISFTSASSSSLIIYAVFSSLYISSRLQYSFAVNATKKTSHFFPPL